MEAMGLKQLCCHCLKHGRQLPVLSCDAAISILSVIDTIGRWTSICLEDTCAIICEFELLSLVTHCATVRGAFSFSRLAAALSPGLRVARLRSRLSRAFSYTHVSGVSAETVVAIYLAKLIVLFLDLDVVLNLLLGILVSNELVTFALHLKRSLLCLLLSGCQLLDLVAEALDLLMLRSNPLLVLGVVVSQLLNELVAAADLLHQLLGVTSNADVELAGALQGSQP